MIEKILDKITTYSQKLATQAHLRSLRDSFIIAIPFLVLAGVLIVFNFVVLDQNGFFKGTIAPETMINLQQLGTRVLNGTMNILSVMLAVLVAFNLANKKKFDTPIIPAMVSLASFFTLMPTGWSLIPTGMTESVIVSGIAPYQLLSASGVFLAIMTAFISTEIFILISNNEKLKINLGDEVPPMVAQSFNSMFSIMITVGLFAIVSYITVALTGYEVYEAVQKAIQAPLVHITTGLSGFITLGFFTNFLFALGIHPAGIVNPILEPPLLVAMNENMAAFASGLTPPHIIVLPFRDLYGHIGGTGSTISLLLAILIKSRLSSHRKFAKTVAGPAIFNINEPVIFGFPIVMNPMLIIPFVFYPLINYVIAYTATSLGMVGKIVAYTPWSVPPILSGYLASGGDIRNSILQVILITVGVMCYLPFLIAYERGIINKNQKKIVDDITNNNGAALQQRVSAQKTDPVVAEVEITKSKMTKFASLKDKKIVLMCNEGMSTSLMAKRMEKHLVSLGLNTQVYAVNSGKLETESQHASLILLGPQLSYMRDEFIETTKNVLPIETIDPNHFAKMDAEAVLDAAVTYIG